MLIKELYDHYKTWTKLSKALDIAMNGHQYWRKIGYIPYPTQLVIEKKTNGLFKANIDHATKKTD